MSFEEKQQAFIKKMLVTQLMLWMLAFMPMVLVAIFQSSWSFLFLVLLAGFGFFAKIIRDHERRSEAIAREFSKGKGD
jgi:hypothetical protein